ncbi:TetR/AcrR family transcriptional regulator [Thermoleophilia bacterium SCSIO 60948]|nr:TetR/AcrR family transcriptional regulator [Thermoleophilia bacterium SCSIO 60948]
MTETARRHESEGAGSDNRSAILAAAREGIAADGVRGMRLESIAAQAGVSVPLLYYHFESRAGLIRAVMANLGEAAPSERLRDRAPAEPAYDAIRDALMAELDDDPAVREDALVWGEIGASAVFDAKLRDELARVNAAWSGLVALAIGDGVEDGSIAEGVDPGVTADLLVSLVDGLCTRWLSGSLGLDAARAALDRGLSTLLRPA